MLKQKEIHASQGWSKDTVREENTNNTMEFSQKSSEAHTFRPLRNHTSRMKSFTHYIKHPFLRILSFHKAVGNHLDDSYVSGLTMHNINQILENQPNIKVAVKYLGHDAFSVPDEITFVQPKKTYSCFNSCLPLLYTKHSLLFLTKH